MSSKEKNMCVTLIREVWGMGSVPTVGMFLQSGISMRVFARGNNEKRDERE